MWVVLRRLQTREAYTEDQTVQTGHILVKHSAVDHEGKHLAGKEDVLVQEDEHVMDAAHLQVVHSGHATQMITEV